jgi:hypothetical protein
MAAVPPMAKSASESAGTLTEDDDGVVLPEACFGHFGEVGVPVHLEPKRGAGSVSNFALSVTIIFP